MSGTSTSPNLSMGIKQFDYVGKAPKDDPGQRSYCGVVLTVLCVAAVAAYAAVVVKAAVDADYETVTTTEITPNAAQTAIYLPTLTCLLSDGCSYTPLLAVMQTDEASGGNQCNLDASAANNGGNGSNGGQQPAGNNNNNQQENPPPNNNNGGQQPAGNNNNNQQGNPPPNNNNGGQQPAGNNNNNQQGNPPPNNNNGGQQPAGNNNNNQQGNPPPNNNNGGQQPAGNNNNNQQGNPPPNNNNGGSRALRSEAHPVWAARRAAAAEEPPLGNGAPTGRKCYQIACGESIPREHLRIFYSFDPIDTWSAFGGHTNNGNFQYSFQVPNMDMKTGTVRHETMKIHFGTTLMSLVHKIHKGHKDASTASGFREIWQWTPTVSEAQGYVEDSNICVKDHCEALGDTDGKCLADQDYTPTNAMKTVYRQAKVRPFPTFVRQTVLPPMVSSVFGTIGGGIPLITGAAAAIVAVWKMGTMRKRGAGPGEVGTPNRTAPQY